MQPLKEPFSGPTFGTWELHQKYHKLLL